MHGDTYDYSRVCYTNSKNPVEILCPQHGLFRQKPEKHWIGRGCPLCGRTKHKPRFGTDAFLIKARAVHGDTYDYAESLYTGSKSTVQIRCREHGMFEQVAEYHWAGNGCPRCGREKVRQGSLSNVQAFIAKAHQIHGTAYQYADAEYTRSNLPLTVLCPEHGTFTVRPDHHLAGAGCPACGVDKRATAQRLGSAEFVAIARQVHGDRYDYSRVQYHGAKVKVEILCRKHGAFWQEANSHQRSGCPSCVHHHTRPQREIEMFLTELGCAFQSNTRSIIAPKELDIYIPQASLAIELNGAYWHSLTAISPASEKFAHREKYRLCQALGIHLLQIDELEWQREETQTVWKSILRSKLGLQQRIFGRHTRFRPISNSDASAFLAQHHLQGAPPGIRWAFGLFAGDDLVAVAAFILHEKTMLNLSRLAFRADTTVVGGAQKILKGALQGLPSGDIVTFSDNRYSQGSIYPVLGFTKDKDLAPSYQWFYRGRLLNKRQCRHAQLPTLLGDLYDPSLTEHQNMFRAGARCLYDAGYQRWVLPRTV